MTTHTASIVSIPLFLLLAICFGAGIAAATPSTAFEKKVTGGQRVVVTEEEVPDPRPEAGVPDPSLHVFRYACRVVSADGKKAEERWSCIGNTQGGGIDARVRILDADLSGDTLVVAFTRGTHVRAQVVRRSPDGSPLPMPAADENLFVDLPGIRTTGARIEGTLEVGQLRVTFTREEWGKPIAPTVVVLLKDDEKYRWGRPEAVKQPQTKVSEGGRR